MRVSTVLGRVLRLAVPALVVAWAPGAWAQYDMPEPPPADEETDSDAGRPVRSPAAEPGLPGPTPDFERAPRTYTVQEGDTLWDITRRFLGNAWYWPKVWSSNPELVNPNWIRPGHVLRFEGGDLGPTEIAAAEELAETPAAPPSDQVVDQTAELSYRPTQPTLVIDEGFVTDEELDEAGRIAAAFEEKMLLTTYDRAYVEFREGRRPEVGDRFVIFRTTRRVRHPATGEALGWLTEIIGTTRVTEDRGGGVVTVEIGDVIDAAERGDRLMPYTRPLSRVVNRRENTVELDGIIAATLRPTQVVIGEYHYVFIDKGAADGVQVGNTFEILRRGDPLQEDLELGEDDRLPWEVIGRVLAVDVREGVTTGVVLDSVRELDVGDRAVMRVGGGLALR